MRKIYERYRELGREGKEVLVLTTEKDAMHLAAHSPAPDLKEHMHAIRIHVHFLNEDQEEFERQIMNYVNSNKRSSSLYTEED